jgi:hypothetical protein
LKVVVNLQFDRPSADGDQSLGISRAVKLEGVELAEITVHAVPAARACPQEDLSILGGFAKDFIEAMVQRDRVTTPVLQELQNKGKILVVIVALDNITENTKFGKWSIEYQLKNFGSTEFPGQDDALVGGSATDPSARSRRDWKQFIQVREYLLCASQEILSDFWSAEVGDRSNLVTEGIEFLQGQLRDAAIGVHEKLVAFGKDTKDFLLAEVG